MTRPQTKVMKVCPGVSGSNSGMIGKFMSRLTEVNPPPGIRMEYRKWDLICPHRRCLNVRMGKTYESMKPELQVWLEQQKVFFVATAPLSGEGHVNCSPKGGDTFRILTDREVAYLDLTGSGIETAAHVQENGRIVVMFCAFSGPPKIVRLHGKGEVIYPHHPDFAQLSLRFPEHSGIRSVIRVAITRISDSCGYSVPLLNFVAHRDALDKWAEKKGPEGLSVYRREKNQVSIDGLSGYKGA
jgi:pyridoxamine 5'-phosphate oxidase-like protein